MAYQYQLSNTFRSAMVINGHGAKTDRSIEMDGHDVYTPGSLNEAYVFQVPHNFDLENDFRQGNVYPVKDSQWQHYTHSSPDVDIKPWKINEASIFIQKLLSENSLWSNIDNERGNLLQRDPNASILIKDGGELKILKGQALLKYCQSYSQDDSIEPIVFMTPKLGKVKVLNPTTMGEILDGYKLAYQSRQTFMLATCNSAGPGSKSIKLESDKPAIKLHTPVPGLYNSWQRKPQPIPSAHQHQGKDSSLMDKLLDQALKKLSI